MADGSKTHTPGGGGPQEQGPGQGQAPGSPSSVRLRAEEVVERGLRLYAHGDLVGALAEWRRALEIDRSNRRGRDYVAYVEDHFELLTERFRAARELREADVEPLGLAIEIEADDPMEDMSPYESIELEGSPAQRSVAAVDEDDGESTSPTPGAPHLRGDAAGGKLGSGRSRPWGRRSPVREIDEQWPIEESWPSATRSNDTLEMRVDPSVLDDLDDLGPAAAGAEEAETDDEDDGDELYGDAPDGDELYGDAPDGDEGVSVEEPLDNYVPPSGQTIDDVLDAVDEEDIGPGESTLPSRPHRDRPYAQRGMPTAEGSGPLDASRLAAHHFGAAALVGPDLHDADIEAWADGTPPVEAIERDGVTIDDHLLARLTEDDTPEVRVTFRRSPRTTAPPGAAVEPASQRDAADDGGDDAADGVMASDIVGETDAEGGDGDVADGDAEGGADSEDDESGDIRPRDDRDSRDARFAREAREAREDAEDADLDRDDDDVDEEELTIERHGVSSRVSQFRRLRATTPVPPRRSTTPVPPRGGLDRDAERATTELTGRRRPMAHTAISIDLVSADLLAELDTAMADAGRGGEEQLRCRVGWLIDRARRENRDGRYPTAVVAVDLALDENPESAVVQKLIHSNRELFYDIYSNYLGDMRAVPGVALPMSSIPMNELDHRAAFLLSRVDGVLSLEDVLDVAGMARLEAFRHLSRLMLRGILEIRP